MNKPVTVYFIPHTHWDREWYLTQKQFQYRLQYVVDGVLKAMGAPDGSRLEKFTLDGQTVILEDIMEWQPGLRVQISELIRERRLEIGPWYTMPDLYLPTPDALRRNLMRGRRDCEAWGVPQADFIYVPDSFGMPPGVPGLLHNLGIGTALFGRGLPPSFGPKAVDFRWASPDGSASVTALSLPGCYQNAAFLPPPRDKSGLRAWLGNVIADHASKAVPDLIGAFNGVDHIEIQRDLPEIIASLRGLFPQHKFVQATLSEYVRAVQSRLPLDLPTHKGALQGKLNDWEVHGTWSSRQDIKREDYYCSHLLGRAEGLVSEVIRAGGVINRLPLDAAWDWMMQNHAHDSICGCSPDDTAADQHARYRWIKQTASDTITDALRQLSAEERGSGASVIFSPPALGSLLGYAEITLDLPRGSQKFFRDSEGFLESQRLRSEIVHRRDVAIVHKRGKTYEVVETVHDRWQQLVKIRDLERTDFVRLATRRPGSILVRKGRPLLDMKRVTGFLKTLEITGDVGGLYAHAPTGKSKMWQPLSGTHRFLERGPLRWSCRAIFSYPELLLNSRRLSSEPASLRRQVTVQLFPHFPVAIVEEVWTGRIEFARVRLPLPVKGRQLSVDYDQFDQVLSSSLAQLEQVPADHPYDRSFFFRSWLQVRNEKHAPVTLFGNGLHEFGISPGGAGLSVTLMRPQGYVTLSGDWPAPGAQFNLPQIFRYGIWLGEITPYERGRFCAELAVPVFAEVCSEYVPEKLDCHGYATTQTRVSGIPVPDSPANWRPVPNYRGGWRYRGVAER